jgi:hypothetical protein
MNFALGLGRDTKAGLTRLVVRPRSRSSEALDAIRRFADEVIRRRDVLSIHVGDVGVGPLMR